MVYMKPLLLYYLIKEHAQVNAIFFTPIFVSCKGDAWIPEEPPAGPATFTHLPA